MTGTPEHYDAVLQGSPVDQESVTYVVVAGATRAFVAETLGLDLSRTVDPAAGIDNTDHSAYALIDVTGGIVAFEGTGYADPSNDVLVALSSDGRSAAVTRSNIQAHVRFGCARNGELLFDDDEYTFIDAEDLDRVPAEIRPLFDIAWDDPDEEAEMNDVNTVAVGLAMAEVITGVAVTAESLIEAHAAGYHRVRSLQYNG